MYLHVFSMCRAGKQSCFPSSSTSAQRRFELHKNSTDLSTTFSESVEAKKRHKEVFCNFDPLSDACLIREQMFCAVFRMEPCCFPRVPIPRSHLRLRDKMHGLIDLMGAHSHMHVGARKGRERGECWVVGWYRGHARQEK